MSEYKFKVTTNHENGARDVEEFFTLEHAFWYAYYTAKRSSVRMTNLYSYESAVNYIGGFYNYAKTGPGWIAYNRFFERKAAA